VVRSGSWLRRAWRLSVSGVEQASGDGRGVFESRYVIEAGAAVQRHRRDVAIGVGCGLGVAVADDRVACAGPDLVVLARSAASGWTTRGFPRVEGGVAQYTVRRLRPAHVEEVGHDGVRA